MISKKCVKICLTIVLALVVLTFIFPYDPSYSVLPTANLHQEDLEARKDTPKGPAIPAAEPKPILKPPEGESAIVQNGKMFVILVTGFRTGSTFLGELFNQNPEVLYMFEPFHQNNVNRLAGNGVIQGVDRESSLLEKRSAYLEQITQRCDTASPSFWWMSKGLSCGTPEENQHRFGSESCPKYPQSLFSKTCKEKDIVALKLIRIQRIEHLNLVPGLKNVNFKVIHLIRDPRGTMNSRKKFPSFYIDDIDNIPAHPLTKENLGQAAENLCTREEANLEFSQRLPDYMKGRYLRVTHDEMSLKPLETAEQVYSFINRPIPPLLDAWLIENTTTQKKGVLGTSKDSKAVLRKWRDGFKLEHIRVIEDKCKGLMKFMGYKVYDPDHDDEDSLDV